MCDLEMFKPTLKVSQELKLFFTDSSNSKKVLYKMKLK